MKVEAISYSDALRPICFTARHGCQRPEKINFNAAISFQLHFPLLSSMADVAGRRHIRILKLIEHKCGNCLHLARGKPIYGGEALD